MVPNTRYAAAYAIALFSAGVLLGILLSSTLTAWHPGRYLSLRLHDGKLLRHASPGSSPFNPTNLTVPYSEYTDSSHLDWSLLKSSMPLGVFETSSLRDLYPRSPPPAAFKPVPFHWVIKSCFRPMHGRLLTTTILSGLFNGLQPASISIAWCKPFNKDQVPSILYNLRHSLSLNVFYPPEELIKWEAAATLVAYTVPQRLGAPHLPLLVTEDDIMFAPDAGARIAAAVQKVEANVKTDPYMLTFYWGDIHTYNHSNPPDMDAIQSRPDDYHHRIVNSAELVKSANPGLIWGAQVQLCSPGMTPMLYSHFRDVHAAIAANNQSSPFFAWGMALTDMVIFWALEKHYKCNQAGSACHAYIVQPSLIQHAGTVSTLFSQGGLSNARFHYAHDYPMHVRFATLDNTTAW